MDKKILFNDALTALVEFAGSNANHVTIEDINTFFKDILVNDSQYELIYAYLQSCKITIEGMDLLVKEEITSPNEQTFSEDLEDFTVSNIKTLESDQELAFIKMYMQDLEAITPLGDDELNTLVIRQLEGDFNVTERLIETHLALVAELAKDFRNQGISYGDLIQEGNIGLMTAISKFDGNPDDFINFLRNFITNTLKECINNHISSSRVAKHLADRANNMDSISAKLTNELGRAPTVEELSKKMGISEEEVQTIIKTSLSALSLGSDSDENDDDSDSPFGNVTENVTDDDENDESLDDNDPLEWRINKK